MNKVLLLIVSCLCISLSHAQTLADFETAESTPLISADGNVFGIVDNPDKSGINTSNKVGYYHKQDTNWQYFTMTFSNPVNIGNNNTLTFKVHASIAGRIFAKFWSNGEVLIENWAPDWNFQPVANKWVECTVALTPAMNKTFDVLQIAACVDNNNAAEVYLDDFNLSNPDAGDGTPFAKFTVSKSLIETGDSITFNASDSYDYDGEIVSYEWDFGDGETDTGMLVTHKYLIDSVFSVKLTITDNDSKSSIAESYIFVVATGEKLSKLEIVTNSPETSKKVEAIFQVNEQYTNVYNPDEITVDAEITLPDNSKITLPCFYFEKSSYNKSDWVVDSVLQCWMLRFSSHLSGIHKIALKLNDKDGENVTDEHEVNIAQGSKKGIVRNDTANHQYYRHSSGEPFYPMGINAGWDNITDYTKIISNLGQNNASIIRYWHAGFARQTLEWKTGGYYKGLGYYSQQAAAMTDSLLELCAKNDIYMQLVIFQHGMFSENVDPNWSSSPYNILNGGLIDRAEKFFYNEDCKSYVRKLLRYIIARWGYSSNIFAWEFFNEVQFTGIHNSQTPQWYPGVLKWHSDMSRFVESIDPYNHIMTTSAADHQLPDLDTIKALDVIQYHLYSSTLYETLKDKDSYFINTLQNTSIINGEYGNSGTADVPFDQQRYLVWTSIMTQVPRFMWMWDHYTDASWAGIFDMPGKYLENLDIASEGNIRPTEIILNSSVSGLKADGINTDHNSSYGYIFDPAGGLNINNAAARISGIPYANYQLKYYLPEINQVIVIDSIPLISAQAKLSLPEFSKGIAYKIKYLNAYTLPIAIAGRDTMVSPGTHLTYSGLNSVNPYEKPLNYLWRIVSKPAESAIVIADPSMAVINITTDIAGQYEIGLIVNDDSLTSSENIVNILVTSLPVAIAGKDTTVSKNTGIFVILNGSASYDPEGSPITYQWNMISKPEGSNGTIFSEKTATPIVRFDSTGVYLVTLLVHDGIAVSLPDTLKITITPITGIDQEILKNFIQVFPNPCSNVLYVEIDNNITKLERIEIFNLSGKLVHQAQPVTGTNYLMMNLDRYKMQNGVYFLKTFTSHGFLISKLILKP